MEVSMNSNSYRPPLHMKSTIAFKCTRILAIASVLAACLQIVEAATLYSCSVTSDPPGVAEQEVTLLLDLTPEVAIPAGGIVELRLPVGLSLSVPAGADHSCELRALLDSALIVGCAFDTDDATGRESISWTTDLEIPALQTVQFVAPDVFNNPTTTEATETFEMRTYADATKSAALDEQLGDLQLEAEVATLTPDHCYFVAAPDGTGEVGKPTPTILNLQAGIALPAGAIITIDFPMYNPEAPGSLQHGYFEDPDNTVCSAVHNVDDDLQCDVEAREDDDEEIHRLTIRDALPGGLVAGEDLEIRVESIYNPLSTHERAFATALAIVSDRDGKQYGVEEGYTALKATEPTTISSAAVSADSDTVQEHVTYEFKFTPDVEIEAGAYAMVQFPNDGTEAHFAFDNQLQSMTTIGGMFGSRNDNAAFIIDGLDLKVETEDPTVKYSVVSQGTMTVSKVKNPWTVGSYGSFKITIYDNYKDLIATTDCDLRAGGDDDPLCQVHDGLYLETTPGDIEGVTLTIEDNMVDRETELLLWFTPRSSALSADSLLLVELQDDLSVECPRSDYDDDYSWNSDDLAPNFEATCGYSEDGEYQLITIKKPFRLDYAYDSDSPVSSLLVFLNTTTPRSARHIQKLRLTLATLNGEVIDYYESTTRIFFEVVPAPFQAHSLTVDSQETYTDAIFTFVLRLSVNHTTGDYLEVVAPPEVAQPTGGVERVTTRSPMRATTLSCEPGAGEEMGDLSCQVIPDAASGQFTVRISDWLDASGDELLKGADLDFSIEQLRTPLTTRSSASFEVYTKDIQGYQINYLSTDMCATMTDGKAIQDAEVSSSSSVVGAIASHTIRFTSVVPITSTDTLMVLYPATTFPPLRDPDCTGGESLRDDQYCRVLQDVVSTTSLPMADNVDDQDPGAGFALTIEGSSNPQTGRATDIYKLWVLDQDGYVKSEFTDPDGAPAGGMRLTMTIAATITSASLTAVDDRQLALTAFELEFRSEMPYPAGSYVVVAFDSTEMGPFARVQASVDGDRVAIPEADYDVACFTNLQLEVDCHEYVDTDHLKLPGMFVDELPPGSYIHIMITNFYIDVTEPMVTKSWGVTVYTDDDKKIDEVTEGLSLEFDCYPPCLTCADDGLRPDPTKCHSCNDLLFGDPGAQELTIVDEGSSELMYWAILFENRCYESCPAGTYYDAMQHTCQWCDENCLECNPNPTGDDTLRYNNGQECTSCNPTSEWPWLVGTTCQEECPFGKYGDTDEGQCRDCDFPCQSCTNGPTDCNTCDVKSPKPYYQEGECYARCDEGYTTLHGTTDFICHKCDLDCAECEGSTSNCIACRSVGKTFLSMLDNTCHNRCPEDVTVRDGYTNVCLPCEGRCLTCHDSPDSCGECQEGFYWHEWDRTCHKECHTLFRERDTPQLQYVYYNDADSKQCQECDDQCLQCMERADKCLKCSSEQDIFYNHTCVAGCPDLYDTIVTERGNQCVLTGLICKFGYGYNAAGDGCILKVQVCEGSTILNYDNTACVPVPGFLLPFPLTIIALIGTGLILWDKKKHQDARFYPNQVCMLSVLENVGMICLIALTKSYGIEPSHYLALGGFLFLYGLNVFFALVYFTQIRKDSAFKYWEQEYQRSTHAIVAFGLLINFKMFRLLYSRFRDRKEFDAVFTDELILYRTIMFSSVFYILFVSLPVLVASIFGLLHIQWGYQLQMFCLEMAAIESIILVLMSIELYKIRKHVATSKRLYKVRPREMMGSELQVMAGAPTDPNRDHRFVPSSDDRGILLKLIQRINVRDAGKRKENEYTTIKEIQDLHERQFREHQRRRCMSFRDLREYQDEKDEFQQMIDAEDSEDDKLYNFISEPSSPRSKEMLLNPNFNRRMGELSKAYFIRDKYDNCYHEGKALHHFPYKNCRMVSRTVQTNVLELLGVDDLLPQYSRNFERIRRRSRLNQKIDEESVDEHEDLDEAANLMSKGMVSNVLDNFEGFQEKKKRKKLPPARMRQLPQFEISDLIGNFDIDEDGNFIIIKNGKDSNGNARLEDQDGRRVNQRGYYMSDGGEILMKDGAIVFRKDEVDDDGEIPAPFCYKKNKDSLGLNLNANLFGPNGIQPTQAAYDSNAVVKEQEEEDDVIEREFSYFKKGPNADFGQSDKQRPPGSARSEDGENQDATLAPSKQIKRNFQQSLFYNPNDEDFIQQVSRPMRPKPKQELVLPRAQQHSTSKSPIRQARPESSHKDPDGTTSIDPDFFLHGNIGSLFQNRGNQTATDGGLYGQEVRDGRPVTHQSTAELNETGHLDEIQVPLASRPLSGTITSQGDKKRARRQRKKLLHPSQQQLLLDKSQPSQPASAGPAKDREQEILDGIEKFQAMLQRYPVKLRQNRSSNTLANKNLNKVYGKIQRQFSKNINQPEPPESNAGGVQTPSQFAAMQSRLASNASHSSALGQPENRAQSISSLNLKNLRSSQKGNAPTLPPPQNEKMRDLAQIYSQGLRGRSQAGALKSQFSQKSNPKLGNLIQGSHSGSSQVVAPGGRVGMMQNLLRGTPNQQSMYHEQLDEEPSGQRNYAQQQIHSQNSFASRNSGVAPGSLEGLAISNTSQAEHGALLQMQDSQRPSQVLLQPQGPEPHLQATATSYKKENNRNLMDGGYL